MSTIDSIVTTGHGRAGSHRSWEVFSDDPIDPFTGWEHRTLYHYGVRMLSWKINRHRNSDYGYTQVLYVGNGHGTVSDQQGVNIALRAIGATHLYYSRKGGAHLIDQEASQVIELPWRFSDTIR